MCALILALEPGFGIGDEMSELILRSEWRLTKWHQYNVRAFDNVVAVTGQGLQQCLELVFRSNMMEPVKSLFRHRNVIESELASGVRCNAVAIGLICCWRCSSMLLMLLNSNARIRLAVP